ncbi:MAG TPA: hypothetical protein VEC99_11860, partial [Clostridia bacterium]|nr:hypothetical protein [Clostridia bacterium]
MRRKLRAEQVVWIGILVAALVISGGVWQRQHSSRRGVSAQNSEPAEPVYGGHGLSAWLDGRMVMPHQPSEMGAVINSVGPEALPWLVPAWERYSIQAANWSTAEEVYKMVNKIDPRATSLLPALNSRPAIALFNGMTLLARLAPGTEYESRVVRDIIGVKPEDWDREFARRRLRCLGQFTNSAEVVVPVLIAGVTNRVTIDDSIEAL